MLNGTDTDKELGRLLAEESQVPEGRKYENTTLDRLQLLWDERRTIRRFAFWGLAISILVSLIIPAKYDSTTQLMPPDSDSSGAALLAAMADKGGGLLSSYAGSLLGIKNSGDLFIGILRSRTVEDGLIKKFDLRAVYSVRRWETAREELEQRTYISEDRKSGIITISVRDQSRERAQAMAQTYVDQLNIAVATVSTSSARREREFLETRLVAVKQDLEQAERDFSQFSSKNTAIDIPEQGKAMVEAAARLQGELIVAEAQRQSLEQIYSPNNARVRSVQANIDELRRQLEKLGGAGESSSDPPPPGSVYPSIRQLPLLGVAYADLYRRTKIEEAVYEALTKQYELAKVEEAKEIPAVKVLDPPNFPERKAEPKRAFIVLLGLLLTSAIGCGWVLAIAGWSVIDERDPRKLFVQSIFSSAQNDWARRKRRISDFLSKFASRNKQSVID